MSAKQLTVPIFRNVCHLAHVPEDGGSKLLMNIHYSNSCFLCSQTGRTQGHLRMISHCRGYVWSPTKSGTFRDSAQCNLQISTATYTIKCKPFFTLSFHLRLLALYTIMYNQHNKLITFHL